MKYFVIVFALSHLTTSVAFGKTVTAKKIQVIPRSTPLEGNAITAFFPKDEKDWRVVDQTLGENAKYENINRKYKIESGKEEPDAGDLSRYRFFLTKVAQKKEPLVSVPLSYVQILAGGDFLLLEPLILINTRTWERTDLAKSANISPYFSVLRYSPKGRKILISQFDCAFDCPTTDRTTIWEIGY
jgi:hypothetical protein